MKNMEKILSLFLVLGLCLSLFPAAALAEDTAILSAEVTITAPAAGAYPDYSPVLPADANYYSDDYSSSTYQNNVCWYDGSIGQDMTVGTDRFRGGRQYRVSIRLTANDGYAFSEGATATVNGQSAETRGSGRLLVIDFTFESLPVEGEAIPSAVVTITAPEIGASPDYSPVLPEGALYFSDDYSNYNFQNDVCWTDVTIGDDLWVGEDTFRAGHQYRVRLYLTPIDGYAFSADTTATVNGQSAETSVVADQLKLVYTFETLPGEANDVISSVSVTITAPAAGASPDYNPVLPADANYYSDDYSSSTYQNHVRWTDVTTDQDLTVGEDMFLAGHQYQVTITLTSNDGYAFSADTTATVNGQSAETFVRSHYGQVIITYTFETEEGLEINEVNFPDPVFRSHVAANFDTNGDGWLVNAEIAAITSLAMEDYTELTSVQGIGFFTELSYVMIDGSPSLTELDLSQNTKLTGLEIYHNGLTSLILGEQPALEKILADHNALTAVDLSGAPNLLRLDLRNNQLTGLLDLSANRKLKVLDCSFNSGLDDLDLTGLTALEDLRCTYCESLSNPDLSSCIALRYLNCNACQLTELDLSANTALLNLYCGYNLLRELDLSANTALEGLFAYQNKLSSLDLRSNTQLKHLSAESMDTLTSLNLSGLTKLAYVDVNDCGLTTLDLSDCPLTVLECDHNPLETLILGQQEELKELYCYAVELSELDISGCPILVDAWLNGTHTEYSWGVEVYNGEGLGGYMELDLNQKVKTEAHLPGDINGDGAVNNKDVMRLQKYLKGQSVTVNEAALDVNGDGKINNKDLTRLSRYVKYGDVEIH